MAKKRIAVLTGAGVSAESGLKTYRDNGGMWNDYDPMVVASVEGWRRDPALVLDFYNQRRSELKDCRPNEAHRLIAALQDDCRVDVITQNVDNLHERAGSSCVVHLHGELTKIRPENCCNESDNYSEQSVIDIGYDSVFLGDLAPNGAQLRPHIVFFEEAVPNITPAAEIVRQADILVIIGTSLVVYPAAGLMYYAQKGTPIYYIDPNPAQIPSDMQNVTVIAKPATVGVAELKEILTR